MMLTFVIFLTNLGSRKNLNKHPRTFTRPTKVLHVSLLELPQQINCFSIKLTALNDF